MAVSGTYLWSPELAECIDESFERCKVDPSTLDVSHIISARRSINFLLTEWASDDHDNFRIERIENFPLTVSVPTFPIDPDTDGRIIDILQVSLRRDGTDTTIYPMSRQEWLDIPDKDFEGRPSRYFADKQRDLVQMTLWTVPENSTDTLVMDTVRRYQDAGGSANDPDIPYYLREAFCAGLASRLNVKYGQDARQGYLDNQADIQYTKANSAQRELGDVIMVPASNFLRRSGGRRR